MPILLLLFQEENPKVATPKAATPKVATPKAVTPKVSTPKPATPKIATPKPQPLKTETPKPVEEKLPKISSAKRTKTPQQVCCPSLIESLTKKKMLT